MRIFTLLTLLTISVFASAQSYKKIHSKAVLADTHNDLLTSLTLEGKDISGRLNEGHSDLFRLKEGGVDIQFFSIWTGEKARNKEGFFNDAMEEIDSLESIIQRNPDRMVLAKNYAEVKKGLKKNKLVSLIGVEGGHMIEDDLAKLQQLYDRGMRYMTLTWNNSTSWATSARDESSGKLQQKGLTEFGRQIVKKMNELGILVDLSHVGEQTFYDAISIVNKPVLLSHSSVYAICPVFRNVKDDQIKAVAKNGGVICINFASGFIDSNFSNKVDHLAQHDRKRMMDSLRAIHDSTTSVEIWRKYFQTELNTIRPGVKEVVDHIDYIVKLVGDDYVGIGSDFDGINFPPKGLDDVTTYPAITEELLRRGYSKKSIEKILGGNVMRVMKANFPAS